MGIQWKGTEQIPISGSLEEEIDKAIHRARNDLSLKKCKYCGKKILIRPGSNNIWIHEGTNKIHGSNPSDHDATPGI
jgi:hypothetical protein